MGRRLFNLFAILSLLAFVISVCLWIRSCFVCDTFEWSRRQTDWTQQPSFNRVLSYRIYWNNGRFGISRNRIEVKGTVNTRDGWTYRESIPVKHSTPPRSMFDRLNLQLGNFLLRYGVTPYRAGWVSDLDLAVPLWLFLPAGVVPILWLHRRHRRNTGHGFPVTANLPTSA